MPTAAAQKPKFSVALQTDGYKKLINNTLQDPKRAQRFIVSISSAVSANPALQECDAGTILSCALLGEALELSPSPQLGQFYLIPFDNALKDENGKTIYLKDENGNILKDENGKWIASKRKVATFVLGYKGYIQLAIRSGRYKKLNVLAIKKGELVRYDALNEEIEVNLISDELARETAETIGYYAMFEYLDGYKKILYWSKDKMEQHALRYSMGYKAKKGYTFWEKDFDSMAYKTMLRQLISKWGIMSIEMRQAFEHDDSVINQDGTTDYIGSEDIPQMAEQVEITVNGAVNRETGEAIEEQQEISMSDLL